LLSDKYAQFDTLIFTSLDKENEALFMHPVFKDKENKLWCRNVVLIKGVSYSIITKRDYYRRWKESFKGDPFSEESKGEEEEKWPQLLFE